MAFVVAWVSCSSRTTSEKRSGCSPLRANKPMTSTTRDVGGEAVTYLPCSQIRPLLGCRRSRQYTSPHLENTRYMAQRQAPPGAGEGDAMQAPVAKLGRSLA